MIWQPTKILTLDTSTGEWSKTHFETFLEYKEFILSMWKYPGEYAFKSTENWKALAIKFDKDKRYTDYHENSKEYKEFWLLERRKCEQGIIIDGVYITGYIYFYLNFCRIPNKLLAKETFPELWDGIYHYDLYIYLAWLHGEDAAAGKSRQKGVSLYHMARITKLVWFGNKLMLKVLSHEENYIIDEWNIMQGYRNHLNDSTGWYRNFQPDELLNWEQKGEVTQGTVSKRKVFKGNFSKVKGLTTKMNITKGVGGAAYEIYVTEAGINPRLRKIKEYVDPNIKLGNVKTGQFLATGSVGEMKDAEPLMEMCFNPKGFNIRPVIDRNDGEERGFFFAEEFNFVYEDPKTGEVTKCYDEHGNSDIPLAIELIEKEHIRQKALKDNQSFKLWLSQHPRTLQDAFDQREDNPFPTTDLKQQEQELIPKKDIIVAFERDAKGKVFHKFSDNVPISKLKPNPSENNEGAVIIYEFPVANPPWGLYYAGVDPIYNLETSTSKSLMSIKIFMATHERDGKICPGYEVATYIGRHKKVSETYQVCLDLIEFYQAKTAVESNVRDFIDWMIRQGKIKFLLRRKEIIAISEMSATSTIADEIGVRMTGDFKQKCLEKTIHYMEEPIADLFDLETGESQVVRGVKRLKDKMMIRECLRWTPKLNTDRLVSWMLAYIAAEGNTNRHVIREVKNQLSEKPKVQPRSLGSPFVAKGLPRGSHKITNQFTKR